MTKDWWQRRQSARRERKGRTKPMPMQIAASGLSSRSLTSSDPQCGQRSSPAVHLRQHQHLPRPIIVFILDLDLHAADGVGENQ